jgi:hypothetical protein
MRSRSVRVHVAFWPSIVAPELLLIRIDCRNASLYYRCCCAIPLRTDIARLPYGIKWGLFCTDPARLQNRVETEEPYHLAVPYL